MSYFVYKGIILPVVTVLAMPWFIRYFYYLTLQFLNNETIARTKNFIPQA